MIDEEVAQLKKRVQKVWGIQKHLTKPLFPVPLCFLALAVLMFTYSSFLAGNVLGWLQFTGSWLNM